ncbi:sialate O-acetylesterase [Paraburkholderia sp. DHOC27]|uniref:sialate O-acetylesterase n=1 Tax=Paraburkholderia sp. DHOC27 TaxID=2303330 RepID=UPI00216B3BDC|nr:sialate O-acetylesterase [Paraburkholderia sp. DHOC27]
MSVWRDRYDPVWQYAHTHCAGSASLGASVSGDLGRRIRQVLHTSTANACDRWNDAPETTSVAINDASATLIVHTADARPASALQFSLTNAGGNWTVQKVAASRAGTLHAIYDASQAATDEGRIEPAYSQWTPHGAAPWAITHVITYGQSLSQGFFNQPVLSTHQRYASLRFAGGVRVQDAVQKIGAPRSYENFVPLTETRFDAEAETPTSGTLDMAMQLIAQENLQDPAQLPYRFLGSAPGEGAMDIDELSKSGQFYPRIVRDITEAKRLADAEGKSYGVGAMTWTQGESDDAIDTPIPDYVTKLRRLRSDVDHDAKAITGQTADVELIAYQLATHKSFSQPFPHIALALLQASHEDPHIHIAAPMYLFRYVDGRHTDNRSSQWLGAYYGLVLKRVLIDHETWTPLEPMSWRRDGDTATLRFKVPAPPLQWDTTQVAGNTNYGFALRLPSGQMLPIRSVSITGPDQVQIVADGAIPAGTEVEYAFEGEGLAGSRFGPRGNLRDSQGDAIQFDNGRELKRMDNWCVIFHAQL